jgi:hypothetical protein
MKRAITTRMHLRWVWVLVLGGAFAGWACSSELTPQPDDRGDDPARGESGRGGEAGGGEGGGGEGGGAGDGGDATTKPGGQCSEVDDCETYGDCSTLQDLLDDCEERTIFRSSCGGTYVQEVAGVTASTWFFDGAGKQIGGTQEGEGSCSYWGQSCGTQGKGEPLCNTRLTCIEHDSCGSWGANFGCPSDLEHVAEFCWLATSESSRYASDCGGTIVRLSDSIQTVVYDFDATGKLIGVDALGDVRDCDHWGKQCKPMGEPEVVCEGASGAGGVGGAGDAGGATVGGAGGDDGM